eukprot:COSAG02_NODE_6581_length_3479_cov_18.301479_3_plen_182_part_00
MASASPPHPRRRCRSAAQRCVARYSLCTAPPPIQPLPSLYLLARLLHELSISRVDWPLNQEYDVLFKRASAAVVRTAHRPLHLSPSQTRSLPAPVHHPKTPARLLPHPRPLRLPRALARLESATLPLALPSEVQLPSPRAILTRSGTDGPPPAPPLRGLRSASAIARSARIEICLGGKRLH